MKRRSTSMPIKSFPPKTPGAIHCRLCQLCPQKRGQRCELTGSTILHLGAWRLCYQFQRKAADLKDVESPTNNWEPPVPVLAGHNCSHLGSMAGNRTTLELHWRPGLGEEVLEDLRLWLRHKRSQAFQQYEILRRRAAIKSLQDHPVEENRR